MYKRFYSGYDDTGASLGGALALPNAADSNKMSVSSDKTDENCESGIAAERRSDNILGPLAIDDLLLIGVLLLLLQQDSDDKLMIVIVGFILISGFLT